MLWGYTTEDVIREDRLHDYLNPRVLFKNYDVILVGENHGDGFGAGGGDKYLQYWLRVNENDPSLDSGKKVVVLAEGLPSHYNQNRIIDSVAKHDSIVTLKTMNVVVKGMEDPADNYQIVKRVWEDFVSFYRKTIQSGTFDGANSTEKIKLIEEAKTKIQTVGKALKNATYTELDDLTRSTIVGLGDKLTPDVKQESIQTWFNEVADALPHVLNDVPDRQNVNHSWANAIHNQVSEGKCVIALVGEAHIGGDKNYKGLYTLLTTHSTVRKSLRTYVISTLGNRVDRCLKYDCYGINVHPNTLQTL